jgi:hypothetical protein
MIFNHGAQVVAIIGIIIPKAEMEKALVKAAKEKAAKEKAVMAKEAMAKAKVAKAAMEKEKEKAAVCKYGQQLQMRNALCIEVKVDVSLVGSMDIYQVMRTAQHDDKQQSRT